MFKIQGHDLKEYGPVSAEVLRQWIAERRANAQTMVQGPGDTGFRPLSQFPEFQDALAAGASAPGGGGGIPPITQRPAAPIVPEGPVSNGMAITSLALGICSFCLSLFAGIPAVITGHIALNRIRREPHRHGGSGMAIAGLVLGYMSILFIPILAGLMLPALAKAKSKAQRISCVSNLKQVALGARMYANDNKEVFPVSFQAMSNDLITPKILVCPGDSRHTRALDWADFSEKENLSYEFLAPGAKEADVMRTIVFRCPIHENVAYGDGSVQQMPIGNRRRP
jgi:hypothetical protein